MTTRAENLARRWRHYRSAAACAAALLALGVGTAPAARDLPPAPRLAAPELADHPLAGRIWRVSDGAFVTPAELARDLAAARYVLLGESHDNPDHHRIQAWAAAALFAAGRRPGLAFEMVRADQQAALDAHLRRRPGDAAGLGTALGWGASGWPDWAHYAPIAAPFAREGLPIIGANLAPDELRAVMSDGYEGLGEARLRMLGLDDPPGLEVMTALAREMAAAHCDAFGPERALPFARAQVARDAALARGLIAAADETVQGAAVLIAGSGHVRADRAVPWHLARLDPARGGDVRALAALEVRAGAADPAAYGAGFGTRRPPFDYVWFTARVPRGDPCAAFLKNNKK